MNRFCEHGYDVTLICETVCNIRFDHKCDHRLKRLSFSMGVKNCATRAELLAHFVSRMPPSVFVLTSFESEAYREFPAVIKAQSEAHKVVFLPHFLFASMLDKKPLMLARLRDLAGAADAVVSNTVYAHVSQNERLGGKSVWIPYFYPYGDGEYRAVPPGGKSVLLFGRDAELIAAAMEELAAFVKRDPAVVLKVAAGRIGEKAAAMYRECAGALGLEDRVVYEESSRFDELAQGCAFAVVPNRFVYPCDTYVQLAARRLPVLFASPYSEPAFLSADLARGGVLAGTCAEIMADITRAENYACLSEEASERTFALWETLVADVGAGRPARGASDLPGDGRDGAFLAHFDEMLSRERPEPEKKRLTLKQRLRSLRKRLRGTKFVTAIRNFLKRKIYYRERFRVQHFAHMVMSPEQIRKSQLLALKMFIEFERICKKYNLRYYVAAGSLLGAVRSGGQIPWDDDVDVTLPRPDYDTFVRVAPGELPDGMALPESNYPYLFHRMLIKGTKITRYLRQKGDYGIFLDIVPLDGAPPAQKLKDRHARRSERLFNAMLESSWPQPFLTPQLKRVYMWVRRLLIKFFVPKKLMVWLWERNARKYGTETAAEWVCLPGMYSYEKECFPKEYWGDPVWLMYEGRKVPVMRGWEAFLVAHYGEDYIMPPPVLRRRTHTLYTIDFGKYEAMTVQEIEKEAEADGKAAQNR
jgi:lipopolysaccharide cholinephosphotransferase